MPKAMGGQKKKVPRPVVLPTLSDTDDPAPSPVPAPVPASSPVPAPSPALATAPADEVFSSTPTGWRDSHRSLLLLLNLLPRDRRNNCDKSHMKKRTI